jgi:response regulator RpfG family c-di-GMP phosphodiesterase
MTDKEKNADDRIIFPEETAPKAATPSEKWKILVVDDDQSVHAVTRMVLGNFSFAGKGLDILSAYDDEGAYEAIRNNADIALILLDVVMTEEDSGLRIVKFIREEMQNRMTRIVLRTGQPGHAPEKKVIVDYDINDYKLKTELTADKLFVTMVSSLRAYDDLVTLECNRKGLERIIDSSATLFKPQSFNEFITGVLIQITALLHLGKNALYCRTSGLSARKTDNRFIIEAGIGDYSGFASRPVDEVLPAKPLSVIETALREKRSVYLEQSFVAYFMSANGAENIIYMESCDKFDDWDKNLIGIFCTNTSVALDNIYLNEEIENTQKEIIYTLGEIAEARSREMGHHVKRVAEYSRLLASKLGLSHGETELVYMASPMHDVGKLAVPDAILNKPGTLTAVEYETIKTHAKAGYDMLKNSNREIMSVAAIIALEHQERFDGSGYPFGKKGTEISVFGRIVAIADVFDALGCDRVYKKAWPLGQIIDYFKSERGQQFDPELTDLFIASIDEIVEIRNRLRD